MRTPGKLTNVHRVGVVTQNGSLVLVRVEIVGSRKECNHAGEIGRFACLVQAISCILNFVGANERQEVVSFQKGTHCWIATFVLDWLKLYIPVVVTAAPLVVMHEKVVALGLVVVFQGITPQNVAHQSVSWGFAESIYTLHVFQLHPFGTNSTVNT